MLRGLPTWIPVALGVLGVASALWHATIAPSAREIATRERERRSGALLSNPLALRDVTAECGVDFVHDGDVHGRFWLPEEMGPGVALFDCDADADLDLFVAGGGSIDRSGAPQACRLWRNDSGKFTDVTAERGCGIEGPAYGVAAADYDRDGDVDLFVARLGANALLRNEGARFSEVARELGVADEGFGTAAVWFDMDRDGWLDLYVCNYVDWSPAIEKRCYASGVPDYCDPGAYGSPGQDRLYRNVGGARFEDVTERAGILGTRGQGLSVVAEDFDGDGHCDLYVANDSTPAFLWRNRGDGTFAEDALKSGCAYNALGVAIAGMGIACEDLDGDLRADLFVTNIRNQSHLALLSRGPRFEDASAKLALPAWSTPWTGFGVVLFDADHDGALEGYFANGAVNLAPSRVGDPRPYVEPDQFVRFEGGRTRDVTAGSGAVADESSRGLCSGDIDGDGDLDLVLTAFNGRLRVLRNETQGTRHWLQIDVRDERGGAALGARVELESGGRKQVRFVRAQASYLASSDPRVHFGLGATARVDALVVRWPDGSERRLEGVAVDRMLVVPKGEQR